MPPLIRVPCRGRDEHKGQYRVYSVYSVHCTDITQPVPHLLPLLPLHQPLPLPHSIVVHGIQRHVEVKVEVKGALPLRGGRAGNFLGPSLVVGVKQGLDVVLLVDTRGPGTRKLLYSLRK